LAWDDISREQNIPFVIANNFLRLCPHKIVLAYKNRLATKPDAEITHRCPAVNGREALLENPRQTKLGISYYKLPSKL
jgi:hypothetical protein